MKRFITMAIGFLIILLFIWGCSGKKTEQSENTNETIMKTIDYKDAKIAYTESGEGDTTFLFVHGSFINKEYWHEQVKYFSPRYKVITIDLPGHGKSTSGSDSLKIQNFGNVLVTFMKHLKLKNVILIGHSTGADVILEAAVKYPDPVMAFVAVDYFKNLGVPLSTEIQDQVIQGLKTDFKKTVADYVHQGLVTIATDSSLVKRVVSDYQSMDPVKGTQSIIDGFNYTHRETGLLGKMKIKVSLINVSYSPTEEDLLKKYIPNGYVITEIQGTCHFPMVEKPREFNYALDLTIRQLDR